jgi:hypothetical protein
MALTVLQVHKDQEVLLEILVRLEQGVFKVLLDHKETLVLLVLKDQSEIQVHKVFKAFRDQLVQED